MPGSSLACFHRLAAACALPPLHPQAEELPGVEGLAGSCPLDQGAVVVDQAGREPQMDDRAVACGHEVDHLAHCRGFLVAGHDEGPWGDMAGVTRRLRLAVRALPLRKVLSSLDNAAG
jgi:hypothetical protein